MQIIVLYFHWLDVHVVPALALTPFEALRLFTAVCLQTTVKYEIYITTSTNSLPWLEGLSDSFICYKLPHKTTTRSTSSINTYYRLQPLQTQGKAKKRKRRNKKKSPWTVLVSTFCLRALENVVVPYGLVPERSTLATFEPWENFGLSHNRTC